MTQTLAILTDAYRDLNARKMFWITLILSGLVVVVFALFGVNDKELSVVGIVIPIPAARFVYKTGFDTLLVGIWAQWAALGLALISTASTFPDLLTSGSIDLYLSKPLGRTRLFLTKYATGLIFALLQTAVVAVGSFLVFGIRGHEWRPALFLMIPLILLLYSYLFAFCTLIGVTTRSTIASILLTVLFWFVCWGVNYAEFHLFRFRVAFAAHARAMERQVWQSDADLVEAKAHPSLTSVFGIRQRRIRARRETAQQQAEELRKFVDKLDTFYVFARAVATVVPKTGETVDLLDRKLFSDADIAELRDAGKDNRFFPPDPPRSPRPPTTNPAEEEAREIEDARELEQRREVERETADEVHQAERSRSIPWIIGTSLGFELVMLCWAGWVFQRRDY